MSGRSGSRSSSEGRGPRFPRAVEVERLEERIALSYLSPKKRPEPPPYPPGTRYGLVRRENLRDRRPARRERPRPEVERLEERVALSLLVPKKNPEPPPYPPGTLYGLVRRRNIPDTPPAGARHASDAESDRPRPEVERLEERVALSLLVPKKNPEPPPYPPGADYSLARRGQLRW